MFVVITVPATPPALHSFPTRRSSDLQTHACKCPSRRPAMPAHLPRADRRYAAARRRRATIATPAVLAHRARREPARRRSEEHTSELQSLRHLVCRLLLEKKKKQTSNQ